MSSVPKPFITPEEYLEIERKAEYKSEYSQGEMFAMSGASSAHNRLVWKLIAQLDRKLRSGCLGFPSDMRVHIPATGLYTYPDVILVCGEPKFLDDRQDTLLNPTAIVEVLSPSTEAYDRGRKFDNYRSIESLQEYVMISSERIAMHLFTRRPDGRWLLASADRLDATLELQSVGATLTLADIYEGIDLTPVPAP